MENIKLSLNQSKERKLPSNPDAEQSLIGSVLVNNDIIDEISNIVNSGKFFDPMHLLQKQKLLIFHQIVFLFFSLLISHTKN